MYRLYYGDALLYDPLTSDTVTDGRLTAKTNNPDYLDFTVPYGHALYGTIAEQGETVSLYWDDTCLFVGSIESIETDIEGNKDVSCNGALSWLSDSVVRPYSTVAGEQANTAPSSVDGLFSWYIEQHNAHCLDSRKQFAVGVNQGAALDSNNYIYRSSEQLPETWAEIKSKLVNSLGGYVTVDYRDPLTVNYYADVHDTNSQVIDFGVNITSFSKTVDASDQYTAVRPEGATPDKDEGAEKDPDPITIEGLPDGGTSDPGITKSGDVVYSPVAVGRYGYREYAYSDDDCNSAETLLTAAINKLNSLLSPSLTIEVKAVDLALYMDGYDHLRVGQAVRVRSKLHDTDEYLMVNSISLDLDEPDKTTYTLGAEYSTLTGQQSGYLSSLNGSINTALDTANALSGEVKQAAKDASAASDAAAAATTAAETATTAAGEAATKAEEAKTAVDGKLDADVAEETYATKTALAETDGNVTKAQETADTASQTATAAQATATEAQTAAQAAKDATDELSTLIREDATYGVEVGKSTDGQTFDGIHTTMGAEAFAIHAADHSELATFSANKVELGKSDDNATIDMCDGSATIAVAQDQITPATTWSEGIVGLTVPESSTHTALEVGIKSQTGKYGGLAVNLHKDGYDANAGLYSAGTKGSARVVSSGSRSDGQAIMQAEGTSTLATLGVTADTDLIGSPAATVSMVGTKLAVTDNGSGTGATVTMSRLTNILNNKPVRLYWTGSQPTSAPNTVSGTENINSFKFLRVYGWTSEWKRCSVDLMSTGNWNNSMFSLVVFNGSGTSAYLKCTDYTITVNSTSSWKITPAAYNELQFSSSSAKAVSGIGVSIMAIYGFPDYIV